GPTGGEGPPDQATSTGRRAGSERLSARRNKTGLCPLMGLVGAAILAHAAAAAAQPTAADKALAESLFQESKRLMKDGKAAEACPKLVESYRIVPKLGTLLNLATCHEEVGKTASAWAEFTEAISLATKSKETARVQYARDHVQDLEKRLSHLLIEAPSAEKDLEVKLDGKVIGAAV